MPTETRGSRAEGPEAVGISSAASGGPVSGRAFFRDRYVAAAVFLAALLLRVLHWYEIERHDPFFAIPSVDGAIYDAWAREILAGDGLGEGVLFLGPLYPLFMACVYAIFGASLPALKAVQALLGAGSCVLVWGLARELFDHRVAALAGGLAAFYGMLVFYGGTVMIVNLQVPLVVGLVWCLVRTFRRPSAAAWMLCGGLLGLSVLARQTVLLLAPLIVVWLLLRREGEPAFARRLGHAAIFLVTLLALILPFTVRNYLVGGDLVLLNSTGGANFYMGNQRSADGTWTLPSIGARHRVDNPRAMRDAFARAAEAALGGPQKPSQVSAYWLARGLDEIRADPRRWLGLELRKFGLFWNAYEVWNNRSIDVSRRFSRVLRLPLVSFGVMVPFGLLGLALTARRWRELFPVHATLGVYLASALLFFVLSRYRLPAIVLLMPFAAFAAIDLGESLARVAGAATSARAGEARSLALRVGGLLMLAWVVHLPLDGGGRMQMAYYNLGNKFRELERWDEAVEAYRDSLAENPHAISTHNNLALTFELAGRRGEAIEAWTRVGELAARLGDRTRMARAARHLAALGAVAGPGAGSPEE